MAERRGYGGGSMRERAPGVWSLRVMNGSGKQVERTFKGTEPKARKALAAFLTEQRSVVPEPDPTVRTVSTLLDAWLEHIEPTRAPKTVHEYRRKIETRVRPALGSIPLDQLGADVLDRQYRTWGKELAPSTVHHLHAILSAAFNTGVRWGWLASSPVARAEAPPLRSSETKPPTPEEFLQLYVQAQKDDPLLATAIALAGLSGARRGELCALRWSDVDLVVGRMRIAKSLTLVAGIFHEGPTKTHQVRSVALDTGGIRILRERWEFMTALSLEAASPLVEDPYVLSDNANGAQPLSPHKLTDRFLRLAHRLKLYCRFHDLRHFSVTTLIAAGVDIRTVAERHGHSQATMTLNRYAHALPERDREAASILGRTLELPPAG